MHPAMRSPVALLIKPCAGGLSVNLIMTTETFEDGSTIETDEVTGNRTVCGPMAHREYFKRLRDTKVMRAEPVVAVVEFCVNPNGTRKAELIRRTVTNPITCQFAGDYTWEVWDDTDPEHV